jgi:hypothetical protein
MTNLEHPALREQLECYSIPYGGIGFASHFMAYYVAVMLCYKRSPWAFRRTRYQAYGQIISTVSIIAIIATGTANIAWCNFDNSVRAVAIWEMLVSLFVGMVSYHAAKEIKQPTAETDIESKGGPTQSEELGGEKTSVTTSQATTPLETSSISIPQDTPPEYTSSPEVPGPAKPDSKSKFEFEDPSLFVWVFGYSWMTSAFITGTICLAVREIAQKRSIERITLVFGTIAATIMLFSIPILSLALYYALFGEDKDRWEVLGGACAVVLMALMAVVAILGPLYSDWILGALASNLAGLPGIGSSIPIYVLFTVARLLPLLSF